MLFSTKRSSRFRSSTTQLSTSSLCQIHHNPRQIFTNLADPFPIHTSEILKHPFLTIFADRFCYLQVNNAGDDSKEMDVNFWSCTRGGSHSMHEVRVDTW